MTHPWDLRCPTPTGLVTPVRIDPTGRGGPTEGQARGPGWRRAGCGLYVPSAVARTVEQRICEAAARLPPGGAVTGWAALRLAGGGFFDGRDPLGELPVPVVMPDGRSLRPGRGMVVFRDHLEREEVTRWHGVPCTSAARALYDAMRQAGELRAAVACADMAYAAALLTPAAMRSYVAALVHRRGLGLVRAALDLTDADSRAPTETALRLVWVLDAGLPPPRCNPLVAAGTGAVIGSPDLLSVELGVVGEYDGAEHRSRQRQREDVRREELFRAEGLECFRVVGPDLADRDLVVRRIRAAVDRAAASTRPRTFQVRRGGARR